MVVGLGYKKCLLRRPCAAVIAPLAFHRPIFLVSKGPSLLAPSFAHLSVYLVHSRCCTTSSLSKHVTTRLSCGDDDMHAYVRIICSPDAEEVKLAARHIFPCYDLHHHHHYHPRIPVVLRLQQQSCPFLIETHARTHARKLVSNKREMSSAVVPTRSQLLKLYRSYLSTAQSFVSMQVLLSSAVVKAVVYRHRALVYYLKDVLLLLLRPHC